MASAPALPFNLFRPHPLGDGGGGGGAHAEPLGQCRSWRPVTLRFPPVNLPAGPWIYTQPLIGESAPPLPPCHSS